MEYFLFTLIKVVCSFLSSHLFVYYVCTKCISRIVILLTTVYMQPGAKICVIRQNGQSLQTTCVIRQLCVEKCVPWLLVQSIPELLCVIKQGLVNIITCSSGTSYKQGLVNMIFCSCGTSYRQGLVNMISCSCGTSYKQGRVNMISCSCGTSYKQGLVNIISCSCGTSNKLLSTCLEGTSGE